jgi:hypothetical protein
VRCVTTTPSVPEPVECCVELRSGSVTCLGRSSVCCEPRAWRARLTSVGVVVARVGRWAQEQDIDLRLILVRSWC